MSYKSFLLIAARKRRLPRTFG